MTSVIQNASHHPLQINILIIAHPDDESLFFMPYIMSTQQNNIIHNNRISNKIPKTIVMWLLCLTTGNYNGLGTIRYNELMAVGSQLGFHKVVVIDEPNNLPDHPTLRWNISDTSKQIQTTISTELYKEYGYECSIIPSSSKTQYWH